MVYHHIQFICATRISACQGLAIQPYKQHIPRNMHTVRVFRARLNIKTVFPGMRISHNRLIFIMGIPILVRRHLYIETAKYWLVHSYLSALHNWHWGNHMIAPVPTKISTGNILKGMNGNSDRMNEKTTISEGNTTQTGGESILIGVTCLASLF